MTRDAGDDGLLSGKISRWDQGYYIFFAVFAVVALLTFRDYGYSWDEAWHNRWYGQAVLRFFSTFGQDLEATTKNNFYLYGGTFDALAELLVSFSPMEPRNARHLANLLAGLLCLWGTWKTSRLVGGPAAGFWSAFFLAVSAPFYGHTFINAKDIPFAAGYIWSLYFLLRTLPFFPHPPLKVRLLFALSLGLTLGIRIGGLLIFFYYALFGLLDLIRFWRRAGNPPEFFSRLWIFAKTSLPVLGLSYLLMLVFWPAALLRPLSLPLEALRSTNHFDLVMALLWNGQQVLSTDLPWNYLPVLFAVELPEILVVLLLVAVPWAGYQLVRTIKTGEQKSLQFGLLLLSALFPALWAIVSGMTLYDNMRHFLFVLPPLFCLGGMAFATFTSFAEGRLGNAKWLPAAILILALCYPVAQMASLHPYEYTYLNSFAGGMPNGAKKFETDYWITSYREAAAIVEAHARKVAELSGVPYAQAEFTVALVGSSGVEEELLPQQFRTFRYGFCDKTDYLIATTRSGADGEWPEYPVIGSIGRKGMIFAVVKVSPELAALVENGGRDASPVSK